MTAASILAKSRGLGTVAPSEPIMQHAAMDFSVMRGATLYQAGANVQVNKALYEQLSKLHEAGINTIRVPVSFQAHVTAQAPYVVEEGWIGQIASFLEQAFQNGFRVILSVRMDGFESQDAASAMRYAALWEKLDEGFAHRPITELWYELDAAPGDASDQTWNDVCLQIVRNVRKEKQRNVMIALPENVQAESQNSFFWVAGQMGLTLGVPYRADMPEEQWQNLQGRVQTLETNLVLFAPENGADDAAALTQTAEKYGFGSVIRAN
ncbi:MAG: cellulase family glycosylhydrolase [Clostridia bacterium]